MHFTIILRDYHHNALRAASLRRTNVVNDAVLCIDVRSYCLGPRIYPVVVQVYAVRPHVFDVSTQIYHVWVLVHGFGPQIYRLRPYIWRKITPSIARPASSQSKCRKHAPSAPYPSARYH